MKVIYVANDGKQFDDKVLCEEYEKHIQPFMLDRNFKRTDEYERAEYIYVRNEEDKKWIREEDDWMHDQLPNEFGWWIFDINSERYVELNAHIKSLIELREKLRDEEWNIKR